MLELTSAEFIIPTYQNLLERCILSENKVGRWVCIMAIVVVQTVVSIIIAVVVIAVLLLLL